MNTNRKTLSNFFTGIELMILCIIIITTLPKLYHEKRSLVIVLKLTKTGLALFQMASLFIMKYKKVKIMEIYEEINLPYSKFYGKSNRNLYSTITWISVHVITYTSMVFAVIDAELKDLIFDVSQNILFHHHGAISVFFMNYRYLTMLYIYSELNIRYLYVLDAYWNRLKTIHIKPSYFLLLEIRNSISKLKISENNLKSATFYVPFIQFTTSLLFDITVVAYGWCLPVLRPSFYIPISIYFIVTHVNLLINYFYIIRKRKVQQEIETKLFGWNY